MKKEESKILHSRYVPTGRVAKRIASMFRKAGGEKIETEGKRGKWKVSAVLTHTQAAKFLSLEADHMK